MPNLPGRHSCKDVNNNLVSGQKHFYLSVQIKIQTKFFGIYFTPIEYPFTFNIQHQKSRFRLIFKLFNTIISFVKGWRPLQDSNLLPSV